VSSIRGKTIYQNSPLSNAGQHKGGMSMVQKFRAGALSRVQPETPGINIMASALIAQNYNVAGRIFN
jgi:hypothetical protein